MSIAGLRTIVDSARGYGLLARYETRALLPAPRRSSHGKSFLLLAPFLPPYDNGGVARPLSWLQYAGLHGWDAFALTRPFVGEPSNSGRYLQSRMPGKTSISLMHEVDLRPSWSLFPRTDGTFLGALGAIATGDRLIREHGISVVVATGPSFDVFVSGYYLARMHKLPLLLDYRDEWTECPFGQVQCGNSDRFWERRCLEAATLVLFTTDRMMKHAQSVFPRVVDGKAAVLHNGWEPRDSDSVDASPVDEPKPRITLIYAGTMGGMSLPGAFLSDLDRVLTESAGWRDRVTIRIIGERSAEAAQQLDAFAHKANLVVEGKFAKNAANAAIRASDVLLLLAPRGMDRYIPAKLFEYLAADKPILVHGASGEATDVVTALGAGLFVPQGDPQALARALEELQHSPREQWRTEARRTWVADHTREALAAKFFGMVDGLVR